MNKLTMALMDEVATQTLAQQLAHCCSSGVIHLLGDLGAGKTTLTRYWLQALGHHGNVKSPTYTLVEPYQIAGQPIYHFDLYRLQDPYELELLGIRDYLQQPNALLLIEWPSKGEPLTPPADVQVCLTVHQQQREVELSAHSPQGEQSLLRLTQALAHV